MTEKMTVEEYIAQQRASLAGNPDCGMSHYNLATALLSLRKFDEAEKEFLAAAGCSPTLAEAYVQLGGICLQRGDMEGCLAYNQKATTSRPRCAEAYGNIGFIQLQKGEVDKAIEALEKAVQFNELFIQAYTTLANAYLFKGWVDKSIEANTKALEIDPSFAVAHNNLAIAYLEKQDYDKAGHHCEKARSLGYEVAPEIITELDNHKA